MNNVPIGIIDSGSGGLSIWKEITTLLPYESTIYLGDHAYLPYSEKSTTFIRQRVAKLIDFLTAKHVKLIVIACNTATVAGIDRYRLQFPSVPIIGVVPVIKTAAEVTKTQNIVVLSTVYTANSSYQQKLIKTYASKCQVECISSSRLVEFIESPRNNTEIIRKELRSVFRTIDSKIVDTLVLGCTHFPFISDEICRIVGSTVHLLDSGGAVARHVKRILTNNNVLTALSHRKYFFYTTGYPANVTKTFQKLLKRRVVVVPAIIH